MLLLLLISACAWISESEVARRFDQDQDGHLWPEDCDDTNPNAFPGGDEVCGGGDEDCDDEVDEGGALDAEIYYLDLDNDTYGDPYSEQGSCSPVAGYVLRALDCDDTDPTRHPEASEDCDGLDDDCDDQVDEDPTNPSPWYRDDDSDGFGDADRSTQACSPPSGFVGDSTDCDDTLAAVHPGAAEVCNDGLDNNCDGSPNSCTLDPGLSLSQLETWVHGETGAISVGFGGQARAADLDGDGQADLALSAPGSTQEGAGGVVYIFFGPLQGTLSAADADVRVLGESGSDLGRGLDVLTDYDGGAALLLGAPGAGGNQGAALVMPGAALGTGSVPVVGESSFPGASNSAQAGTTVLAWSDPNRDGLTDIVVGMPNLNRADGTAKKAGQVCLYDNTDRGEVIYIDSISCIRGTVLNQEVGTTLGALGDMDGNGRGDIAFGNPEQSGLGVVYLAINPLTSWVTPDYYPAVEAESAGDQLGATLTGVGDVDGDGYGDALLGAPGSDAEAVGGGAVYLIPGAAMVTGWSGTQRVSLVSAARFAGASENDAMAPAASLGDANDDGVGDLVLASPGASAGAGTVYLFYGPIGGAPELSDAEAQLTGSAGGQGLGATLTLLPDVTGDLYPDLWIGAPGALDSDGALGGGVLLPGVGP